MSGYVDHGWRHLPKADGGTDPIPGLTIGGGGGGGIQFETYPQAGDWLYVETTTNGSPSGFGVEIGDSGTGGINLAAYGGGPILLDVSGGGNLILQSSGALELLGSNAGDGIRLAASAGNILIGANDNTVVTAGDLAILASEGSTAGTGMYVRCENHILTIHTSDGTGDPTGIGTPWLVIDTTGGGSYHMQTGASWVADL